MRKMAAGAMAHRAGSAFVQPRTVLAGLDSPHADVRDAAKEALFRALVGDRETEGRYHAVIGLATARKVRALQTGGASPAPQRAAGPWAVPPQARPAQSAAAAAAPVATGDGWLAWLTAALAAALATTLGALAAVAKLTAPFLPPPPPPEESSAPGEPQDWVRRAA